MIPANITDQEIVRLRAIWEYSRVHNYEIYENYYGGSHPWEDVISKVMRDEKDADGEESYKRFWKPANMAYVVIEEAAGYWANAVVKAKVSLGGVRDQGLSELVSAQLGTIFNTEREEIGRSQALYGEGILRVRTPREGMLKGYAVAPYQAGPWCMTFCEDPDEPYRVTEVIYQFVKNDWLWAHHITPLEIRLVKLAHVGQMGFRSMQATAATFSGMDMIANQKAEMKYENPWGRVPFYSFFNGNGVSDLMPMLNAQDSLNKAIYNLESAAEYHGFPLLEVRGYTGQRDDDGRPIDLDVGAGSYIDVDIEGGVTRMDAADLTQLLAAEARGYMRVAQQGRSPSVLMEYSGLGDSGRVPGFLLEPLKMRLNSKRSGATHALELLARDLIKYRVTGAVDLDPYTVEIEIDMPLPTDKIGEAESRAREVDVGAMTGQQAARLRGEDPVQYMRERAEEYRQLKEIDAELMKSQMQDQNEVDKDFEHAATDEKIRVEKVKPKPKPPARPK